MVRNDVSKPLRHASGCLCCEHCWLVIEKCQNRFLWRAFIVKSVENYKNGISADLFCFCLYWVYFDRCCPLFTCSWLARARVPYGFPYLRHCLPSLRWPPLGCTVYDARHSNRSTALTYYPYLNKQTKQVGQQIGLGSCSMHKWMKGNVWRIKNVKRVSVKPEKTSWNFWNISWNRPISWNIYFKAKNFMKFYTRKFAVKNVQHRWISDVHPECDLSFFLSKNSSYFFPKSFCLRCFALLVWWQGRESGL